MSLVITKPRQQSQSAREFPVMRSLPTAIANNPHDHQNGIHDKENISVPNQLNQPYIKESSDIQGLAKIAQKQLSGRNKEITEHQRSIIDQLTADPFILDEDRKDIEQFQSKFPMLCKSYIPTSIIGEGTFSTVYKAIDVKHFDTNNQKWIEWSRQDPEDAPRLLAYVQKLSETWSNHLFSGGSQSPDKPVLPPAMSFSNLNMALKEFVQDYIDRLLAVKYDVQQTGNPPPIAPHFVAIKRINPTSSPERLIDEITFLKELGGKHNVVPVITGLRHQDQVLVVFPYFHCQDFREYLGVLSAKDVSVYMRLLFEALSHLHDNKIIHRDIKPSNFLFSAEDERAVLVDFGLAQREGVDSENDNSALKQQRKNPEELERTIKTLKEKMEKMPPGMIINDTRPAMKASRAGTRGFRAPEVLFKSSRQTCSIDVWSAGVILLTMMTRRYPFFQSSDDQDAIVEIACLFGNDEMAKAATVYSRLWTCDVPTVPKSRIDFRELVGTMNPNVDYPNEAFDLLEQCLKLNVEERITAAEALKHPFIRMYQQQV